MPTEVEEGIDIAWREHCGGGGDKRGGVTNPL